MEFRVLGPLEVVGSAGPLTLGGTKQRATLGFLLLHANRVVATSQLVSALWPADEEPASARKIIQNAVWGLRGALAGADGSQQNTPALLTRAPGYRLQVEPHQVDLHLFHHRVGEGRDTLAAGDPEKAASLLRQALDLWRGPALVDLIEAGVDWTDLTAVEKTRLNATEDWFEAELACGRHHSALTQLETMVESEPLRERSCGLLMVALYRCGRQADALTVYDRARSGLVENLGLEPGRELQSLQRAILTHDPALELPCGQAGGGPSTAVRVPAQRKPAPTPEPRTSAADPREEATDEQPTPEGSRRTGDSGRSDSAARDCVTHRLPVSVVLVRIPLTPKTDDVGDAERDIDLHSRTTIVREEVERRGGTMVATIGSLSLAAFGVHDEARGTATRAVRAALAVRDRYAGTAPPGEASPLRVAVATGEALVRYQPGAPHAPASVVGTLLDTGESLLRGPANEVWACARTRSETGLVIGYEPGGGPAGRWRATGVQASVPVPPTLTDRDCELDLLSFLLRRTRHRRVPHMVTLLGEAGVGKTRLLLEFERQARVEQEAPVLLVDHVTPTVATGDARLAPFRRLLLAYCGITPEDSGEAALDKLGRAVDQAVGRPDAELTDALAPLAALEHTDPGHDAAERALGAWRNLMVTAAGKRPLVLVLDDLHAGPDSVVDGVEQLVRSSASVPLLVVASARPRLLTRYLEGDLGTRHFSTLTLEPLPDAAGEAPPEPVEPEGHGAGRPPSAGRCSVRPPVHPPDGRGQGRPGRSRGGERPRAVPAGLFRQR